MNRQFSASKKDISNADHMSMPYNNIDELSDNAPQEESGQYSRKAFNKLQKLHSQTVGVQRIATILRKFTVRNLLEVAMMIFCLFALKSFFAVIMTFKTVQLSSIALFFSSVGGAVITGLLSALCGLFLSKKLLLSPAERHQTTFFQGAGTYMTFAAAMSFLSFLFAIGMQMTYRHDTTLLSLLMTCGLTILASAIMSMFIVQYGLLLPAAAANRKRSMAIACEQVRPFWKSLFAIVLTAKTIMAFLAMVIMTITQSYFVVSLLIGFLSSIATLYIYLSLSASYAAAGYLFNTDFDIQKDDFTTV